jgi:DNA-binding XRE family transcriptional regulator
VVCFAFVIPNEAMTPPPKPKPTATDSDDAAEKLRQVLAFNLRMERAALRMSQRDLSKATGVSQKHISAIELKTANPGISVLAALAKALPDVTAADLLTPPAPKNRRR